MIRDWVSNIGLVIMSMILGGIIAVGVHKQYFTKKIIVKYIVIDKQQVLEVNDERR